MKWRYFTIIIGAVFGFSGCGQDFGLMPPKDGEDVFLSVKIQNGFQISSIAAAYRSNKCKVSRRDASFKLYEAGGFQSVEVQALRLGRGDMYEARISKEGGGHCDWRLSNIIFRITHRTLSDFGEDAVEGGGGGVVIVFDDNKAGISGAQIVVEGDLSVAVDYYPWVSEHFIGHYVKYVSLFGVRGSHIMYTAVQARKIHFEPRVHSNYVMRSAGPKEKKEGNYTVYTYPDSSVFADGGFHPSFRKLESIRHSAEGSTRSEN